MDVASVKATSYKGATSHVSADGTVTDTAWLNTLRTALDNGPAAVRLDGTQPEASETNFVQTKAEATEMEAAEAEAAETEAVESETAELDATQTAAQADTAAPNPQAHEVQYLDAHTNTTKTGYVINGDAYEDEAGTIPVSDYSRFRTSDGVLQVKTPYGTIRAVDFDMLLEYQNRYDSQTFGQPIIDADGNIIGTARNDGDGMFVGAALDSYTSAPRGPGSISQEIFDQYYSGVAGTTPTQTVAEALAEEDAAGSGSDSETSASDAATSGASDVSATETRLSAGQDGIGSTQVSGTAFVQAAFTKSLLSSTIGTATDSMMDDIVSMAKVMNASRYQQLFNSASF